jgi:DNA invertase Pin-like site-specific DNA recombinase
MKKVKCIYIRTSTTEQTPELQLRDINSIVNGECEVITEQQSAWKDNVKRPELDALLTLIRKGKVSDLYVWDLDRIYRNRKKLVEFFILCRHHDTKVHSYNQNWLEDLNKIPAPFNEIMMDLLINLLSWTSEEESNKKSNRVKMAVKRTEKGTYSTYGNKWGRKPVSPQTLSKIKEMHNQGMSLREISEHLVVFDRNRNEKKLSKSAVHKLLHLKR